MKDLAPDPRAGLPALGKQQAGPAFHGHSLLSLPGQVPGASAAPGPVPRISLSLGFLGTG